MIMRISHKSVICLIGCLGVISTTAWAGAPIGPTTFADQVILVPDDPNSIATIDGPWDTPILIRVVTISDEPFLAGRLEDSPDPSQPHRVATAVRHPSGEIVQINLVEVAQRVLEIRTRRGTRQYVEWVVNTELPFTRDAQLQAAIEGFGIHRQAAPLRRGIFRDTSDSTCWVTGQDVVQIPVLFDTKRNALTTYGVRIVPGDEFGTLMSRDGEGSGTDETNGGDPAGNPDQPPLSGDDGDPDGTPDVDGDPIDGPLEGGDPGGNPDPPHRGVG